MRSSMWSAADGSRHCSRCYGAAEATPSPARSPDRSSTSTCGRSISRIFVCSAVPCSNRKCSATWCVISNAVRSDPCWPAYIRSLPSFRHSRNFWRSNAWARSFSFHEFSASQPLQCQLRDRHVLHSHAREVGDADVLRATAPERRVLNDTAEFHEIPRLDQSLLECECGIAVFRTLTHAVDGANLGERQEPGLQLLLTA